MSLGHVDYRLPLMRRAALLTATAKVNFSESEHDAFSDGLQTLSPKSDHVVAEPCGNTMCFVVFTAFSFSLIQIWGSR